MQTRKLLIVDWSNVLYRAWFGSQRDIKLKPWLPILRFLEMMGSACNSTGCDEVIFAGESKTKLKRAEIDPTYKSEKKQSNEGLSKFRKDCAEIISYLWSDIISIDGEEADDVIASIVDRNCYRNDYPWARDESKYFTDVFIFSNDRDLYQLLAYDRVFIYHSPRITYGCDDFIRDYGFDPIHFTKYKAIVGDKSDGIKGCDGFGPSKATKMILEDCFDEIMASFQERNFNNSLELIKLHYDLDVSELGGYLVWNTDSVREYLTSKYQPEAVDEIENALLRMANTFDSK